MEESEQDKAVLTERKPVTKLHTSSISVPTPGLKPLREVYNKEKQKNTESYQKNQSLKVIESDSNESTISEDEGLEEFDSSQNSDRLFKTEKKPNEDDDDPYANVVTVPDSPKFKSAHSYHSSQKAGRSILTPTLVNDTRNSIEPIEEAKQPPKSKDPNRPVSNLSKYSNAKAPEKPAYTATQSVDSDSMDESEEAESDMSSLIEEDIDIQQQVKKKQSNQKLGSIKSTKKKDYEALFPDDQSGPQQVVNKKQKKK